MSRIILFNKPFGVVTQFSPHPKHRSLSDFIELKNVYPAGRLDVDSEGLLILTDDGALQHRISDPRHKLEKVYWAQVEGVPDERALGAFETGIELKGYRTLPAGAQWILEPQLWPRTPPIRQRRAIPTSWLEIRLREGKNRQVRHMTAAVGLPTLRLIRVAIGTWRLDGLRPGAWRVLEE
mgnify:CR=1 FL=1